MTHDADADPTRRLARNQARRLFIRDNHPDRGGDPQRFVEGLRQFDDLQPAAVVTGRPHHTPTERVRRAVTRLLRRTPPRVR